MSHQLLANRPKRFFKTNSFDAAFVKSAGPTLTPDADAYKVGTSNEQVRYLRLVFFGEGLATKIGNWKIWHLREAVAGSGEYIRQLYLSGTCTLGATAGLSDRGVKTTEKYCDGITITPADYGTHATSGFGGVAARVHNPGSNGIAELLIPEFGNGELCELETTIGTCVSLNALVDGGI